MLRITKQTDYGIMLLAHLADLPPDSVVSARDAASWAGLSLPMVSKILKSLARSGILESQRGVAGGYRLVRPASEIRVADVIRALEGPISMVECMGHPGQCGQETICPARVNWARINREIERALERIPLSEMVGPQAAPLLSLDTERS